MDNNSYGIWQNLAHFVQLIVYSGCVIFDNKFKLKVGHWAF